MNTRKLFPLLLCALALTMTACLDKAESHYTPRIVHSPFVRNSADTLSMHFDNTGRCILDTISTGDTVRFVAGYASLGNNLLTVKATWDKQYCTLLMEPPTEVKEVMLDSSDTLACIINLPIGYNYIATPYIYVAQKAGSPVVTFTAISDSKFSPGEVSITTPIREKQE